MKNCMELSEIESKMKKSFENLEELRYRMNKLKDDSQGKISDKHYLELTAVADNYDVFVKMLYEPIGEFCAITKNLEEVLEKIFIVIYYCYGTFYLLY